jgi:hypothetical protein
VYEYQAASCSLEPNSNRSISLDVSAVTMNQHTLSRNNNKASLQHGE